MIIKLSSSLVAVVVDGFFCKSEFYGISKRDTYYFRLRFHFGSVATDMKGYHSPQNIHNFVLDSGEYINKIQLYHGTALASTIDTGVWDMIIGISFYTNRGIINFMTGNSLFHTE